MSRVSSSVRYLWRMVPQQVDYIIYLYYNQLVTTADAQVFQKCQTWLAWMTHYESYVFILCDSYEKKSLSYVFC